MYRDEKIKEANYTVPVLSLYTHIPANGTC